MHKELGGNQGAIQRSCKECFSLVQEEGIRSNSLLKQVVFVRDLLPKFLQ